MGGCADTGAHDVALRNECPVSWFLSVNDFARATPWLHAPMRIFAQYGIGLFAALLLWSWWRARRATDARTMAAALWAPVGALVAIGVNQPISNLVAEPRPYTVFPHALVLVGRSSDYSFPSDHAVLAGAVAAGVMLTHRRLGLVALLVAIVMAFARVYVGAHFPRDVIVGLLLGAGVVVMGYLVVRRLLTWVTMSLTRTALRPLLTDSPKVGRAQ